MNKIFESVEIAHAWQAHDTVSLIRNPKNPGIKPLGLNQHGTCY